MLFVYSLPKKEASETSTEVGQKVCEVNKSGYFYFIFYFFFVGWKNENKCSER